VTYREQLDLDAWVRLRTASAREPWRVAGGVEAVEVRADPVGCALRRLPASNRVVLRLPAATPVVEARRRIEAAIAEARARWTPTTSA
jgi:hypothetical protein